MSNWFTDTWKDMTGRTARSQQKAYNSQMIERNKEQEAINAQAAERSAAAAAENAAIRAANERRMVDFSNQQAKMMSEYKQKSYAQDVEYDKVRQKYAFDTAYQKQLMAKTERDAEARTKAYTDAGDTYKNWDKQEKQRYLKARTGEGQTTAADSTITKEMYQGAMDLISGKREWKSSEADPTQGEFKYGGYKGTMSPAEVFVAQEYAPAAPAAPAEEKKEEVTEAMQRGKAYEGGSNQGIGSSNLTQYEIDSGVKRDGSAWTKKDRTRTLLGSGY